jgi:hypothetical protein
MKNRIQLLRIIKILSLVLVIILLVGFSQKYAFVFFSDVKVRMDGFYLEDKNSLDVVIIGASEVYNDFSPAMAYGEYGFTSYCVGAPNGSAAIWRMQLEEALSRQDPQLIVFEINAALFDDDELLFSDVKLRQFTDNVPLSMPKIEAINEMPLQDERISYYFPFIKYHGTNDYGSVFTSVITELGMEMRGYSLLKGVYTSPKRAASQQTLIDITEDTTVRELMPKSEQYLREFLEYCQINQIDNIVFARFPHRINSQEKYERFQRANRAAEIINEYGYPFVNLEGEDEAIGLIASEDYYDNDHLNIYGQQKFTRFFSELLLQRFNVKGGNLTNIQSQQWDTSFEYVKRFYQYVEDCMKNNKGNEYIFETFDVIAILEDM